MDFQIATYLEQRDPKTNRGSCKACRVAVPWAKDRVAAHKRSSCATVSTEDKRFFAKRTSKFNLNNSSPSAHQNTQDENGSTNNIPGMSDEQKKEINSKLGRFFFRTGVSFRLVDSEAFKDLIQSLNPEYASSMPSSKTLAGSLLDQQYSTCSHQLEEILSESSNLCLVSDGWTNIRGDHIVNFCIKAPNQKPFFYSSINTSGITQNAQAVADSIIHVLEKIGPQKFSCVVTDNAAVMRASWKLIEAKFCNISAYGCAAHGVNLLIKDILDTPESAKTMKDADKIIKFVTNHHIVKAKYEEKRKASQVPHTLTMPVATRWFSRYTSLNDLHSSKYVLIQLVDELGSTLQNIPPKTTSAAVMKLIASNEFWEKLSNVIKSIKYPANVIGKLEADNAPLPLVYRYFGEMFNHFKNDEEIQEKVSKRLEFLLSDVMGLAYLLTPKCAAQGFFFNDDQATFIAHAREFALRINPEIADLVEGEMLAFLTKMSTMPQKQEDVVFKMSALTYWSVIGRREFPALFEVAEPIIQMICSSATAERTWSIFNFIHSRLRNRLTNEKVEKLVFIYINCAMLDDIDKNDYLFEAGALLSGNDYEEASETAPIS